VPNFPAPPSATRTGVPLASRAARPRARFTTSQPCRRAVSCAALPHCRAHFRASVFFNEDFGRIDVSRRGLLCGFRLGDDGWDRIGERVGFGCIVHARRVPIQARSGTFGRTPSAVTSSMTTSDEYKRAVGDGTVEKPEAPKDEPLVVESNASNYGASAVEPPAELEKRVETDA